VDALDHAFRNAVNGTWPQLDRVHLSDYKVRILEAEAGTDAVTRVLVSSTDGHEVWDTVGVHANVVEASWFALSDAYTYAIMRVDWDEDAGVSLTRRRRGCGRGDGRPACRCPTGRGGCRSCPPPARPRRRR
jgi:hypothetical protein